LAGNSPALECGREAAALRQHAGAARERSFPRLEFVHFRLRRTMEVGLGRKARVSALAPLGERVARKPRFYRRGRDG
jgi:hypothetical protein